MKKFLPVLSLLITCVSLFSSPQLPDEAWERAYQAWDNGDYLAALHGFDSLLKGPESARWLDRIALVTGELYPDTELTPDGRSPRFSPSGRYLAYESGARPATVTHILSVDRGPVQVADIQGEGLVFSPTRDAVAYLRPKDTPEITALRQEVQELSKAATQDRQALAARQRQLTALETRSMDLFMRDLPSGREQRLDDDGLFKTGLVFSADGREICFAGARSTDSAANEIYGLQENGKPHALTSGPGFKTSPVAIPGGMYLVYTLAQQSPFAMPAAGEQTGRGGQGAPPAGAAARGGAGTRGAAAAGAAGGRGGPGGRRVEFAVLNLAGGKPVSFSASAAPAVSADGSTLAFISGSGGENSIQVLKLKEPLSPAVVRKSQDRIGSVSLVPNGSCAAFEMPWTRDKDTEIFCIGSDGTGEIRISREIQPDWAPRFLSGNRILAIKGERRHARSFVYDLDASQSFKLFHNNTVRTIAPEYEWAANPAGDMILIVAERDGDTISPQRGVYLIDLGRKITRDELLARIRADLASEQALRTAGETMFRPIADTVRGVVDRISMTRLYEYQENLFKLGIKAIGQPGNKSAGDYIFNTFASFGYKPEYQWFDARGNTRTANVLATLAGTENPELIYVLGSHYDSVPAGPGADDNSTGIAAMLEAARTLANSPMPATIVFAAFTGEEAGDLGSHEYVRQAKDKLQLIGVLNNDMIGWTNDHHLDNTIRYTNDGMRDLQHAAAFLFSRLITYDTRYYKSTDAAAFYDACGDIVSGLGSYPVLGNPYYHQATDLLETVNQQLVMESAKMTAASIMLLAASPARVKDLKVTGVQDDAVELSWAASPEKGVVSYTVAYGTANNPLGRTMSVKTPKARIAGLKKGEPMLFSVKAVSSRGLSSWDWARTTAKP
jgi:Tol biopolymer transport system component